VARPGIYPILRSVDPWWSVDLFLAELTEQSRKIPSDVPGGLKDGFSGRWISHHHPYEDSPGCQPNQRFVFHPVRLLAPGRIRIRSSPAGSR